MQHSNSHTSSIAFLLFPNELGSSSRNNDGAWLNHTHPQPAAAQSRLQSPGIQNMAPTVRGLDTAPGLEENASSQCPCPWPWLLDLSRRDEGVLHRLCSCMRCHRFLRFRPVTRWFGTESRNWLVSSGPLFGYGHDRSRWRYPCPCCCSKAATGGTGDNLGPPARYETSQGPPSLARGPRL
jgi:hypothetical protein